MAHQPCFSDGLLADIEEELGERFVSQIRDDGGDALFIRLDVTSEQGWIEAIQTVVDRFGRLDILFNNAGGRTRPGDVPGRD